MAGQGLSRAYHPGDSRIDVFSVNESGVVVQKVWPGPGQPWGTAYLPGGAIAGSVPQAQWLSSTLLEVWAPAPSGTIWHWVWNNGAVTFEIV